MWLLPLVLCLGLAAASPATLSLQHLGNRTFTSDYRNCWFNTGVAASTAGEGYLFLVSTADTNGVPCIINYGGGYAGRLAVYSSDLSTVNDTPIRTYVKAVGQSVHNASQLWIPSSSWVGTHDLTSGDASDTHSFGSSPALPYASYDTDSHGVDVVHNVLYYAYYFSRQFTPPSFGIIGWQTNTSTQVDVHVEFVRDLAPLSSILAFNRSIGWFAQGDDLPLQYYYYADPSIRESHIWNISTAPSSKFLDAALSPANTSHVLFLIGDDTSTSLYRLDVTTGQVSAATDAGDATCLVVGWRNFTATAGPSLVSVFDTEIDAQGVQRFDSALPVAVRADMTPFMYQGNYANGAFARGFKSDASAVLFLSATTFDDPLSPSAAIRSIRLTDNAR